MYELSLQQQKAVYIMWKELGKDVYMITESFSEQEYPILPRQVSKTISDWKRRGVK